MGVNGLWKILSKAGEQQSLQMYLTAMKVGRLNGIIQPPHDIKVGVDISPLMAECTASTLAGGIHGQFVGGALYILFLKLAALLKCPATFIFVFDGRARPAVKRGHKVKHTPLQWEEHARELIKHFGFIIHNAPGEAEAELAKLSYHGLIDAVMTSDCDAFVFGAEVVFRSLQKDSKKTFDDEVSVFLSHTIDDSLGLPHSELILFVLLCGGDYNTGIKGCGPTTAYGLCRSGFGTRLLGGINTLTGQDLQLFIANWRISLRLELETNSNGMLSRCEPAISASIPDTFPDLAILRMYTHPITSWSTNPPMPLNTQSWFAREPSLWALTEFSRNNFQWTTENVLKKRFSRLIWPGAFMQMLYSPLLLYNSTSRLLRTPTTNAVVLKNRRLVRQGRNGKKAGVTEPQPRITVSAANFIALMDAHFKTDEDHTITVWVHEVFLPDEMKQPGSGSSGSSQPARAIQWLGFIDLTGDTDSDYDVNVHGNDTEVIDLTNDSD